MQPTPRVTHASGTEPRHRSFRQVFRTGPKMLNYPDTAQLDCNAPTRKQNGEAAPSHFPDRHEGQGR